VAFDRVLATRLGVGAVDAVERGDWGKLICLQGGKIVPVALEDAVAQYRTVDPEGALVRTARAVGISFGDF
jgi:6-phosphofructokinase 1